MLLQTYEAFRVLDAYGHLSVRHPEKKENILNAWNTALALLASRADIVEYWVEDTFPVNLSSPGGNSRQFIYSEIYRRYPTVNSIIQSHAAAILLFNIIGIFLSLLT